MLTDITALQTHEGESKCPLVFLLTVLNKECSKRISCGFSALSHINSKSENSSLVPNTQK